MKLTDLLIIGGGPAGYTAALEAARSGAKVRLFEKHSLGGTCLNAGCIPTKTLLESSGLFQKIKKAAYFGVSTPSPELNFSRIMQRKNIVVSKLVKALEKELAEQDIEIIREEMSFREAQKCASKVIIATGTRPRVLPHTLSTDDILNIADPPGEIHIVGAGAVGLEMATLFRQLGSAVTVTEIADQILPGTVDSDVARELQRMLERQGIRIALGKPQDEVQSSTFKVHGSDPATNIEPGTLNLEPRTVSCIGRQFNNEGLAEAGIVLGKKGEVVVDEHLQTSLPGVYAAGDITGQQLLAHVAYAQGTVAAQNALGGSKSVDDSAVPFCVFTNPVLASVGEASCQDRSRSGAVRTIPFSRLGMAQAKGETDGFVRLVLAEDNRRIEGIQILGPGAADLISTATLIVHRKMTIQDLKSVIWTHPTLGEIFGEVGG